MNDPLNGGRVIDYFGWSQTRIDDKLRADLRRICVRSIPEEAKTALAKCRATARTYWLFVKVFGKFLWIDRPDLTGRWKVNGGGDLTRWQFAQAGRAVTATWSGDPAHPSLSGRFLGRVISHDQDSSIEGSSIITDNNVTQAASSMKLFWNPKTPNNLRVSAGVALIRCSPLGC